MKKLYLLLVLFVFFKTGFSQWEPTWGPQNNSTYHLYEKPPYLFMTSLTGCYRSTDGISWEKLNIPNSYINYNYIHFNSCGSRLFLTKYDSLFYSDDNGISWHADTPQNVRRSYVSGNDVFMGGSDRLYYSGNGGSVWTDITGTLPDAGAFCNGISFFQGKLYFASSEGYIYFSPDTGLTWSLLPNQPAAAYEASAYENNALTNDDDLFLYYTNAAGIFRISSEFSSWDTVFNTFDAVITSFAIIDTMMYAGSSRQVIYSTGKTALNWQPFTIPGTSQSSLICDIKKLGGVLYAGSEQGLFASVNDGASWQQRYEGIIPGYWVMNLFVNGDDVWADHFISQSDGPWHRALPDSMSAILVKNDVVIASVYNPASTPASWFQVSGDRGTSWININLTDMENIAVNNNTLFATFPAGLFKSTDLGQSWSYLGNIRFNQFLGMDSVLFIMNSSGIFKSTDDGASWSSSDSGISPPFSGRFFTNGSDLFVLNFNTSIYRSSDLGLSWTLLPNTGLNIGNRTTLAASADKIFVGGYTFGSYGHEVYTGIYMLAEGDTTWQLLNNDSSVVCESLAIKGDYLYGAIEHQGIKKLRIDTTGATFVPALTQSNTYLQLYPNPATGSFMLICSAKSHEPAEVLVYNSQGQLLFKRNGMPSGDEFRETISIPGLPKGLYTVRVNQGKESRAGRIVIQ
ncbi:MAG: hypothetical protein JWO09_224 [Bacteroidetes bacterium]|nr:hypothetical protein [Bacteroidota bacterium]